MSAFSLGDDLGQDRAFRLLTNSPVTLFHRRVVLNETTAWLIENDYQIVTLSASAWPDEVAMHRDIATALDFPSWYGSNLDALNDCLLDVAYGDYGWDPHARGLVLVFLEYDIFLSACPRRAHVVLDLVAECSRLAALVGQRLACLVQSDDPELIVGSVGALPVSWNDAERLRSQRATR